jgi:hypothetical protein
MTEIELRCEVIPLTFAAYSVIRYWAARVRE